MADPRGWGVLPERTATPSQSFVRAQRNPKLDVTPDVRNVDHSRRNEREESAEIFSRPRHYSTVQVENGAINIHVPCVYNGPSEKEDHRLRKSISQVAQDKATATSTLALTNSRNRIPLRHKPKCSTDPAIPPFCSAVRSSSATLPATTSSRKSKERRPNESKVSNIDIKTVWNFEGGKKVSFLAVDYGQELFEQAAATFAAKEMERKLFVRGHRAKSESSVSSKSSVKSGGTGEFCRDFSKPRYNSSRHSAKALHKALADLNNLPLEIEKMVREDKRFSNVVMEEAARQLNIHPSKQVYNNLLSVEPDPSHLAKMESKLLEEMKSMQPVSRPKDPEPNIEDYNELNYSRIKPRLIPLPPKPQSGISVNLSQELHLIASEHKFAEEAEIMESMDSSITFITRSRQ